MFVVEMHLLKEPALSSFVLSPRTKVILVRNSMFEKEIEVKDR